MDDISQLESYSLKNIGKEFVLHHHLGLGDTIICNGLVNYLSTKYSKIYLPVKENLLNTVKFLYSENKKLSLFTISNESREEDIYKFALSKNLKILRVGYENVKDQAFNLAFYKQLGLPYRYSQKYFNIPSDINKEVLLKDHLINFYNVDSNNYSVVHNEYQFPGGKFDLKLIDEENAIYVSKESDLFMNLFLYRSLIQKAQTIHCINSSFLHLVERVNSGAKLYYHNLRKNNLHLSNKWTFVEYDD
tara:strand:- start:639 stop:1379 length:741 start_codon:yes stop_codon:yes gene_type:complete